MEAAVTRSRPLALALALALLAATPPPPRTFRRSRPSSSRSCRARALAVDARLDGVLGVYVRDLTTGVTIELRPDEVFPTASSIKLAVLYELYRQAEEGRIDLAEVTRPPVPRVGGGGILQELGDRVSLTWRDLAVLMVGWSDNEATNVLVRRVGLEAVNRRLDGLALPRHPAAAADDGPRGRPARRRERLHSPRDGAARRDRGEGRLAVRRPRRRPPRGRHRRGRRARPSAADCPRARRRSRSRGPSRACVAKRPGSTSPAAPTRPRS